MVGRWELAGYEVEELIGFGGTGEVWRGRELATGETVALKRLHRDGPVSTERLRREAAMLAAAAGPHVVAVRAVVHDGERAVLVMDHAAGGSLATVLGVRGRLAAAEVVTVVGPLAGALAALHGRGLLHGDLTPANILFTAEGRPLLADAGLARAVDAPSEAVEGTVDYLDPAVAGGQPPTAASDVFSLAAVGYAALAGRPPWRAGDDAELDAVLARAVSGERARLADLAADAPAALVEALEAALAVDPDARPSAGALAAAVLSSGPAAPVRLVTGLPVTPPPPTTRVPPRTSPAAAEASASSPSRRRLLVAVASALAVGLAVLGGVAWGRSARSAVTAVAPLRSASPPTSSPSPSTTAASRPVPPPAAWPAVVAGLETARAAAYSRGDPSLLDSVYAPGAGALRADRATLRSLASRGLRVQGFTATVLSARAESVTESRATLRVVDRLSGYRLVDSGGRVVGSGQGRRDRSVALVLQREPAGWRVASVSPS